MVDVLMQGESMFSVNQSYLTQNAHRFKFENAQQFEFFSHDLLLLEFMQSNFMDLESLLNNINRT